MRNPSFGLTDLPDHTIGQSLLSHQPTRLKPQCVIDQSKYRLSIGGIGHFLSLGDVQRHRLFAEDVLARLDRGKRHLEM